MNKEIIETIVDCLERKLGKKLIEEVNVDSTDMLDYQNGEMFSYVKEVKKIRQALEYFEFEHGIEIADDKFLIERATPVVCHMPNIIGRGRW